jgi:hypothetical protein
MQSNFLALPDENIQNIMSFLPKSDRSRLSRSHPILRNIVEDDIYNIPKRFNIPDENDIFYIPPAFELYDDKEVEKILARINAAFHIYLDRDFLINMSHEAHLFPEQKVLTKRFINNMLYHLYIYENPAKKPFYENKLKEIFETIENISESIYNDNEQEEYRGIQEFKKKVREFLIRVAVDIDALIPQRGIDYYGMRRRSGSARRRKPSRRPAKKRRSTKRTTRK